ncbi:MAG: TetR/AcrR family transcriptional regulator, partial [Actinomycetes bacterium]
APRGRGRPRSAAADAAILRAARELLVEHGIAATSIEQIAKRAGTSKVTVYRRWRTKDDLLAAAVESAGAGIPGRTHEDIPAELDPTMSYDQMVALVADGLPHAARVLADPGYRGLIAQVFGSRFTHPGLMAAFWDNDILLRRRVALALLARAAAEGHLPAGTDVEALLDMTVGAVLYRLLQPGDLDAGELLDYMRRVYRQAGLLPDPGSS